MTTLEPTKQTPDLVLANCLLFNAADGTTHADNAIWLNRDGSIRAVGGSDDVLDEARSSAPTVVDMDGDCVLPGLVNMHTHLVPGIPGGAYLEFNGLASAELSLRLAGAARATLLSGVTTVRLLGVSGAADFALRRAISNGEVDGPRIYTAGQALCCTGGHGWDGCGTGREADGADGFRKATREQIRAGADLIKVCISGGIAGEHESIDTPQLTDDEMAAVLDTAHDWGRKVTAHAGPADAIRRAVELGLDCVEHGYELTAEVTDLMAARGVWYVPTIVVSRAREFFESKQVPDWMMDRALSAGPRHWESLQHALRSGVQLALGCDMPPHTEYEGTTATIRELEFMVEAGMDRVAALQAATIRPIEWLGAQDSLGTLEAGKRADLVAVKGDPVKDVSALRSLNLVIKDAVPYRDDAGRLGTWGRV